ncbi:MAG: hypothetical protein V3574_04285 [Candidatus Moraniibacteriota bacterium]
MENQEKKIGLWSENSCNGELTKTEIEKPKETIPVITSQKEVTSNTGTCAGKRTCGEMRDCTEAYFYLNKCGVGSLNRDKDGIHIVRVFANNI